MLPLLYAFVREAAAAPILLILLRVAKRTGSPALPAECGSETSSSQADRLNEEDPSLPDEPQEHSLWLRALPGLFIFVDQFGSMAGVTLADPVSAAAWQPSQVVFTMLLSACLGLEVLTKSKAFGGLLAISGALFLVFVAGNSGGGTDSSRRSAQLGQLFFAMSCLASSLEVLAWRKLLKHATSPLAHVAVMAESYLVAACFMATACLLTSFFRPATDLFCPECHGNPWRFPPRALLTVTYSVVFQTVLGFLSQAWALRFAEPSTASLYATVQPIAATGTTCALLLLGINPGGVLTWPGWEMLGGLLIGLGLIVAELGDKKCPLGRTRACPQRRSEAC